MQACPNGIIGYSGKSDEMEWVGSVESIQIGHQNSTDGLCNMTIKHIPDRSEFIKEIRAGSLNFFLSDPKVMMCEIEKNQLVELAEYVDVINMQQEEVNHCAGDIVTIASNEITSFSDLKSKRIITLPPDDTCGFQAQYFKLLEHDINIYSDTALIAFESNRSQLLLELAQGNFDAAFIPSGTEKIMTQPNQYKILEPQPPSSFFPLQRSTDLFPLMTLAGLSSLSDDILRNVSIAFFNAKTLKNGVVRNSWTVPFGQLSTDNSQGHSKTISHSKHQCMFQDRRYLDYVVCPEGYAKLTDESDIVRNCLPFYNQCETRDCICSPCYVLPSAPVSTAIIFWPSLLGGCLIIILSSWWIQSFFLTEYFIPEIPIQHIEIPDHPVILGENRYGKIIKARLKTPDCDFKDVAVHRLEGTETGHFDKYFGRNDDVQNMGSNEIWKRAAKIHQIHHPHLLENYGVIKVHSELLLVQEYAEAGTLNDFMLNQTISLDMGTAIRILNEVAMALQCIHFRSPPLTHHVTPFNVWLDVNHSVLLMLSDNFHLPPFSPAVDVFHFGTLISTILKHISASGDIEAVLVPKHLKKLNGLVESCRSKNMLKRINMSAVVKNLNEFQYRWKLEYDDRLDQMNMTVKQRYEDSMNEQKMTTLQNRSVLYRVFPRHIADALSIGKTIQPEHHDAVSILVTDIVGYTTIASTLSPLKVSDMLNRLYLQFDELANALGVFKLETIGDSWLGTTNLIDRRSDHTVILAKFAQRIVDIARRTPIDSDIHENTLQIRAGIHVGAVVASVIGNVQSNPRFCLFGDTINLASRMESASLPGKIQLSEAAASLIKQQDASMFYRAVSARSDKPDIKGKGIMQTFWLLT